jgi:hypothetical protein
LETGQLAAKRTQTGICLGLKYENTPRLGSLRRKAFVILSHISHLASPSAELLTLRRLTLRSDTLVLVTEDQSPLFQIVG